MTKKYASLVTMAAWLATIVATILMLVKLGTWWVTGSVSLLASLVDSLLDMAASITNLLVVRYALQPPDEEHSFGHGKAESLAALAQAMFISGSACFLLLNGVERFFRPQDVINPELGVYVSGFAIILTFGLVMVQQWVVKQTGSQAIAADSLHYKTDLFMNAAIMLALALSWYGWHEADAIFALIIGIYILISAFKMAYEAIQSLLDRQLPIEELEQIREACCRVDGVKGIHDLRTRLAGPTRFIQLHLELPDQMPLVEAHIIADKVEDELLTVFPHSDIIIHQDPLSVVLDSGKDQTQIQ
ncbi:CDF family cation-efflux transporter FieF [Aliivibrio sp. SR45-2]|uniref:CDF family cation-efflux transporter FieF n=1 Tax=Aliivibrio sp. SR45-2 TaxID=2760931 RepID=UPI0015FAB074|nr:CDF family cation-efflux transporter FieF [Aliivibrio sp. SR45-2]MBB1312322.1 CDF family cation-efflux transporter FieF [Aliivibrio sp. SR45-2]